MKLAGEGKVCSFCGEPWSQERRFAGGFGAQICVECIHRFAEMLSSEESYRRAHRPPWDEMTDEELLGTLPRIVGTSEQVDRFLHDWVHLIRERGISWQHIGLALGVSRQAAWERFSRPRVKSTPAEDSSSSS